MIGLIMVLIVRGFQTIENRDCHTREHSYTFTEICTMLFQSTFGDTILKLPMRVPLQTVIITWCLGTFLLASGFSAKLISSLVQSKRLPDINSMRQLIDSGMKVFAAHGTYEGLIRNLPRDAVLDEVIARIHPVPEEDFEHLIGTNKSGNAYVTRKYFADYMVRKHYNQLADRSYYHLMDHCMLTLPEVYLAELNSPYMDYINDLLGRFHASGFFVFWWERSQLIHHFSDSQRGGSAEGGDKKIDESRIKVVITLDHMKAAFCMWALGIAVAMAVFVGEWVWSQYQRFKGRQVIVLNAVAARECGCYNQ